MRKVRNAAIGIAVLVFLVWSGLLWAILAAIPTWAYGTVLLCVIGLVAFIRWAWSQNELVERLADPTPLPGEKMYALPPGEEVIDAEIVE